MKVLTSLTCVASEPGSGWSAYLPPRAVPWVARVGGGGGGGGGGRRAAPAPGLLNWFVDVRRRLGMEVVVGGPDVWERLEQALQSNHLLIGAAPEQWHLMQPNWPSDHAVAS